MRRFIGGDRDERRETRKRVVLARRERLFEKVDPQFGEQRLESLDLGKGPAFIGIDDDARRRRRIAHGADLRFGIAAVDLDLDQRRAGERAGGGAHRGGGVEADGDRGRGGAEHEGGVAVGDALPRCLGFEVPQRAVDRVARRARGHDFGQLFARRSRLDRAARFFDRGQRARDRFAIARIGHAFAAPGKAVVPDFDRHHIRDGLDPARDAERPG